MIDLNTVFICFGLIIVFAIGAALSRFKFVKFDKREIEIRKHESESVDYSASHADIWGD